MEYSEFSVKKQSRKKKKNKDIKLVIMLLAVVAFFAFMIGLITMSPSMYLEFHGFKTDMARAVSSSRENQEYTLTIDGVEHEAEIEEIARFVRFIGTSGMGKPARLTDKEGTYKVNFANGSWLKVRAERVEVDYHETDVPGAYIEFCNTKGEIFSYLTAKLDYKVIERYLGKA